MYFEAKNSSRALLTFSSVSKVLSRRILEGTARGGNRMGQGQGNREDPEAKGFEGFLGHLRCVGWRVVKEAWPESRLNKTTGKPKENPRMCFTWGFWLLFSWRLCVHFSQAVIIKTLSSVLHYGMKLSPFLRLSGTFCTFCSNFVSLGCMGKNAAERLLIREKHSWICSVKSALRKNRISFIFVGATMPAY